MNIDQAAMVTECIEAFLNLVLPALLMLHPAVAKRIPRIFLRLCFSVWFCWMVIIIFHLFIEIPVNRAFDEEYQLDPESRSRRVDHSLTIAAGWAIPLVVCAITLVSRWTWVTLRRHMVGHARPHP
ncbi:hypothetical protein [Roseimicrobium sp. ORNL1]|uniref:hypothetical protein n=1 Tax=Roseimicrobium sp. ORNL1 TaxID=2711231 RepID=UPI0013E17486|nr:hypothetical protein [Roseimicrobium sp. ORNL1]QIF00465.1 hypothetical protein G5S37_02650 [Roseimicrobium sp. ORNL1]